MVFRDHEVLELWRRPFLKHAPKKLQTYRIAVGMAGLETPQGWHYIHDRSDHPSYTYPQSAWVPTGLKGKKIPFGSPDNPIAGAWLGLANWKGKTDGVGIHGTWDRESIGTKASHGCIRMLEENVCDLYDQIPKGTIVYIQ